MVPPLVLDIDGTLTMPEATRVPAPIDPRIFDRLREWAAPVILSTGKAFPFPVALAQFIGVERRVIAETGGIVCAGERLDVLVDHEKGQRVVERMQQLGHQPGGDLGMINRWRETEIAFLRSVPLEDLKEIAAEVGLEVVDTGYAYHVKDPTISKGRGLERLTADESFDPSECVAVGDSPNDISVFERVGESFAVANADEATQHAADRVTADPYATGTLAALEQVESSTMRSD